MNKAAKLLVLCSVGLASFLVSACNACEKLEEKICNDLGAEDCAIWKGANGPDMLYSGRRQTRACINMSTGPTYDALLQGARITVDAHKKANQRLKGR